MGLAQLGWSIVAKLSGQKGPIVALTALHPSCPSRCLAIDRKLLQGKIKIAHLVHHLFGSVL